MSDSTEQVTTDSLPPGLAFLNQPVFVFGEDGAVIGYNDAVRTRVSDSLDPSAENVVQYEDGSRETIRRLADGTTPSDKAATVSLSVPGDGLQRFECGLTRLPADEQGAVVAVGHEVDGEGEQPQSRTTARRERALRQAYDIIADTERSLDTKIHDMLRVVRETIGTEFATLSRIEGQEYTIEAVDAPPDATLVGPDGSRIEEGDSVPLSFTNCERVVETTETLVVEDIEGDAPELANRPVNADMGISCYLGAPVTVAGETYGTFCFYDTAVRTEQFSEWEVTFVELLGNWVSYELERERLMDQIRAEERERYETLVEQSNDGVVIVQDGVYEFVNSRFVELTGQDREALLGTAFEQVFTAEYRDLVKERHEKRIAGESVPSQYDVEIETATGETRTLELAVSRIEHEGEPAAMATFRDITERTRREGSVRTLQQATREMQTAETPEQIAEIATEAAREALGLPLSICWFHDPEATQLDPVVATDPVHEQGYFESLHPDQYEYETFLNGGVSKYSPSETGYGRLNTGVLLPLGDHGLLAAGRPEPTEHDEVILDIARTLAEHTRIALDRIERTRDLERTRARFLALTENTTHGVVTIDRNSTIQYASEGVENVFGYEPEELEGEPLFTVMPERFHDPHESAVGRYLQEGTKQLDWSWVELPGLHKEGHEVPLGITFGETTVDGEQRFSAVIRDITEQRERERELREERAFTESVFAALPDVFYAFDQHGNFLRWNEQLEEVTGYTAEEIETMQPTNFVAPEDQAQVVEAIADVFEHDTTVTVGATFETKDGEQIPYEFTGAKLVDETDEALGLVGIGRDISKRKERQRRFEAVFNNTYQFTGLMEPDGTLIEANETALDFGDLDRDDVVGERVWEAAWFGHSEELQEEIRAGTDRAAQGEFVRDEVTVEGSDRQAVIDFSIRPVTDEGGNVTLLIPEGRDITELKEREQELRRERDRVRRTEELANVGGWELNLDTEEMYWTQGTRHLHEVDDDFEPTLEQTIGFVHPEDEQRAENAIENCRENGDPFDIEIRIITARGRTKWVRVEGNCVRSNGTNTLRGVMGDITDRKEREQRLMVLNRVLRHNLRNKLSVVSGYAEALESVLEAYDSDGELPVDRAKNHTENIKQSASELVTLGEKAREFEQAIDGTDITTSVDVASMLTELADEYRTQYPDAGITVTGDGKSFTGNVKFLKLAVEELLDNAITHNEDSEPTVDISVSTAGTEQLDITVTDDGAGIPEIERKTLTEGKESALLHGSGVGLWTVNWLVTRIGGHVSIADNDSQGSVVTLTLPTTTSS